MIILLLFVSLCVYLLDTFFYEREVLMVVRHRAFFGCFLITFIKTNSLLWKLTYFIRADNIIYANMYTCARRFWKMHAINYGSSLWA